MCVLCAIVSLNLTMALYRYFKPADDVLPSPTGDLCPATVKGHGQQLALNVKIKTVKIFSGGVTGFSRKFGLAKISRYTVCIFLSS